MTLSEFDQLRRELREAGISLWIEPDESGVDRLVCWPAHKLTDQQVATIRANKTAILRWHRQRVVDLLPDRKSTRLNSSH